MSMSEQSERERLFAERVMRFYEREDVLDVADRHWNWRHSTNGHSTITKLNSFALLRLQGLVSRRDYEEAVDELADENCIALADMRLIAEGSYESRRCYYLAANLLPIALGDWYSAEAEIDAE